MELSLRAKEEKVLLLARSVLFSFGVAEQEISEQEEAGEQTLKIFNEKTEQLKTIATLFKKLKLSGLTVSLKVLRPKDWLTRWKLHWKPARLTKKLDVVPVWYKDKYRCPRGRDYILMDTLLSFGTGLHETTQIISQYIEDLKGRFTSFLDIGTGTGILALVAIKHGAKQVYAIDIGELSVQAALDNMKANELYFTVKKADIMKFRHQRQYDFVAANLITHDLIDNAANIIRFVKADGYLAISGISLDNLPRLRKVFAKAPLKCIQLQKGEKWAGLLYQKKK